jgi:hypothetical protein
MLSDHIILCTCYVVVHSLPSTLYYTYIYTYQQHIRTHTYTHTHTTGEISKCINVGSYNYLGFGDPDSPTRPDVLAAVDQYAVSVCSESSQVRVCVCERVCVCVCVLVAVNQYAVSVCCASMVTCA